MANPNQPGGIYLGERTRWVICGLLKFEPFFRNLGQLLPESAAVIYLEGGRISPDVRKFLEEHSITPWFEVHRGTIWPEPLIVHLPASAEALSELADYASCHTNAEIADHCHVYTDDGMIIQWYDACDMDCPIGVGPKISEESVRKFCDATGAEYTAYAKKRQ